MGVPMTASPASGEGVEALVARLRDVNRQLDFIWWATSGWQRLAKRDGQSAIDQAAALIEAQAATIARMGVPEGWKLAPVEPTPLMVRAGVDHRLDTSISGDNPWPDDTSALYRAMLAAAPAP